ncbi:hypothetical protein V5799_000707 [Amblyomma americanum]|uniref:ABC transporter domain-containing protein n=1 Tax=Amblyomma americanum TaxID=6943 RepID=A0AAQ4D2A3_AMBAM
MDVLSSIRTVKMNAWERTHLEGIKRVRERELRDVFAMNMLNSFQDAFSGASGAMMTTTIRRISELCTADEDCDNSGGEKLARRGELILEKCTFVRTMTDELCKPCLEGVDLHVQPGTMVAVVGFVGSGKSTLLSAILGDLHHVDGTLRIGGSLAYVPQVASVFKMSLRDNVLFGKPYDPVLYRRVLDACDLVKDIASFPAGDLTEIGDKV